MYFFSSFHRSVGEEKERKKREPERKRKTQPEIDIQTVSQETHTAAGSNGICLLSVYVSL